jgi:hypothetical protein
MSLRPLHLILIGSVALAWTRRWLEVGAARPVAEPVPVPGGGQFGQVIDVTLSEQRGIAAPRRFFPGPMKRDATDPQSQRHEPAAPTAQFTSSSRIVVPHRRGHPPGPAAARRPRAGSPALHPAHRSGAGGLTPPAWPAPLRTWPRGRWRRRGESGLRPRGGRRRRRRHQLAVRANPGGRCPADSHRRARRPAERQLRHAQPAQPAEGRADGAPAGRRPGAADRPLGGIGAAQRHDLRLPQALWSDAGEGGALVTAIALTFLRGRLSVAIWIIAAGAVALGAQLPRRPVTVCASRGRPPPLGARPPAGPTARPG